MSMDNNTDKKAAAAPAPTSGAPKAPSAGARPVRRGPGGPPRGRGGPRGGDRSRGPRRDRGGRERVRSEFDNKIIAIRRVARVTAGGRRFAFSVTLVAGDRKGSVGVGVGKGTDTALAIDKATRDAKKKMITLQLTKDSSIAHEVEAKLGPSIVMIRPAEGRGLVAGSAVRTVLELAGVRDVSAKILSRSKNRLNNARATVAALSELPGTGPRVASQHREAPKREERPTGKTR